MKLINKFLIGFLALGIVTLVSCNKGDDDGPKEPAFAGTFTGNIFTYGGTTAEPSEWVSSSITAKHDTSGTSGPRVKITANDGNGKTIVILLTDTAASPTPYLFFQNTTSVSTIDAATLEIPASTRTNDTGQQSNGNVYITDNGANDGILKGTIGVMKWWVVGSEINDDTQYAIFQEGSFEVPLTRFSPPAINYDVELMADIDGEPFIASTKFSTGTEITAVSDLNQSIFISISNNATLGQHPIGDSYMVTYINSSTFYENVGTINLTAFDAFENSGEGTFQFTATPTDGGSDVVVTNGSFSF